MGEPSYDLFSRPAKRVFKVTELTTEVKALLEGRFAFVQVEGEISNWKRHSTSGHCYFTIKDPGASLRCVMFRREASALKFQPGDGLAVLLKGKLTVYAPSGDYQLLVDTMEPLGAGALALKFEELKKRLAAEGLFDKALKRPLPFLPRRIGVVSSPTGAAIQDFLRVLHKRWPNMPVLLAPARVQGETASAEVSQAIGRLGAIPDIDVIVVTRGGGSLEDLWPFNEEVVARAIRACPVPVVSAIGHEVDFTISDFAADVRAPTPTGAAEIIVKVKADVEETLNVTTGRLRRAMDRHIEVRRNRLLAARRALSDPRRVIGERRFALDRLAQRVERTVREKIRVERAQLQAKESALQRSHPRTQLGNFREALGKLEQRAERAMRERIRVERAQLQAKESGLQRNHPQTRVASDREKLARLEQRLVRTVDAMISPQHKRLADLAGRLDAMSPLKVLSRGYSLTFGPDGKLVRKATDVAVGDVVRVRVAEGALDARVEAVQKP